MQQMLNSLKYFNQQTIKSYQPVKFYSQNLHGGISLNQKSLLEDKPEPKRNNLRINEIA